MVRPRDKKNQQFVMWLIRPVQSPSQEMCYQKTRPLVALSLPAIERVRTLGVSVSGNPGAGSVRSHLRSPRSRSFANRPQRASLMLGASTTGRTENVPERVWGHFSGLRSPVSNGPIHERAPLAHPPPQHPRISADTTRVFAGQDYRSVDHSPPLKFIRCISGSPLRTVY